MKHRSLYLQLLEIALFCTLFLGAILLSSCTAGAAKEGARESLAEESPAREAAPGMRERALQAQHALEVQYKEAARQIARALDTETLAAQVLMTGVDGKDSPSLEMKRLLSEIPVGAIMLFKYNIADTPRDVYNFIQECTNRAALSIPESARIPDVPNRSSFSSNIKPTTNIANITETWRRLLPFVALDHEGGDVFRLVQVATRLPPASRYLTVNPIGPTDLIQNPVSEAAWYTIRQAAYLSGRELRALGITMNLAPVAEPLAPENDSFLQNRSFAADPLAVAAAAAAFVQGMGEAGVSSVLKHFPASAAADPHQGRSVLAVDKDRLLTLAAPFEALLQSQGPQLDQLRPYPQSLLALPIRPSGVMVAHSLIPAIDADFPASLSTLVMQDWIKDRLGFSGIVLADDLTMKAITSMGITPEGAIIKALRAGADMVMVWPRDLGRFHRLLVEQANSDTLFRERLVDASIRIITIKLLRGLTGDATGAAADFDDEGYGCMRKATEQFLRERNLR